MDSMGYQQPAGSTPDGDDHQRAPIRASKARGANNHRTMPSGRSQVVVAAINRLEQEHIALLLALCDLEESSSSSQDGAMRSALHQLLREDLRRTQHALSLAALGTFGNCEVCQQPLSRRHLSLLPAITRCWACTGRMPREHQARAIDA